MNTCSKCRKVLPDNQAICDSCGGRKVIMEWSTLVIMIGVAILGYAYLFFDPTVATNSGDRVVNFSLMAERQNTMILGGVVTIVGFLMRRRQNK